MSNFDINRFCKTFRWYLGVSSRSLIMWTCGYVVAVFLGELMFFSSSSDGGQEQILRIIEDFGIIFIMIGLAVGFSTLFSDFNKKPKREAFLMLPASNLEKFLSVVVYATVVWTLSVFISFALGDTLRMLYRGLLYGEEYVSVVPMMFETLSFNSNSFAQERFWFDVMYLIVTLGVLMWIHSTYILGGTLFRKYSFVVTSAFIIICVITCIKLTHYFNYTMFSVFRDYNTNPVTVKSYVIGEMSYVCAVVLPLLSVFNYWASFHIFKGFQLITNKWFNYDILKR